MARSLRTILGALAIVIALSFTATSSYAGTDTSKSFPYTGEVSGDSVRLRTGPSTGHTIAGVVAKADTLTVLAEKKGWLKVQMPRDAQCWISSKFVKLEGSKATVTAKNVNLRSRPNTRNVPVGQASETTLTAVMVGDKAVEKDGFVKVVPPSTASVWISGQFVKFKAAIKSAGVSAKTPAKVTEKPLSAEELKAKEAAEERAVFKELELEVAKRLQRKGDKGLKEVRALMRQFAEATDQEAIKTAAEAWVTKIDRIDAALAKAAKAAEARQAAANKAAKIKKEKDAERRKILAEARALLKGNEEKVVESWVAKGFVADHGKKAVIPASHALVDDNGKVIYYIRWDTGSLKGLWDKHVGVSGTVKNYDGWDKPVIVIKNAKEIPEERG